MEEARCDKKLDSDRLFREQKAKEIFEIPDLGNDGKFKR